MCEEERRLEERLRQEVAKSMLENAAWLERERLAQEEFGRKRALEEQRTQAKEEREVSMASVCVCVCVCVWQKRQSTPVLQ